MTLAPPPATRSQTRPLGLRTVSLSEAPVFSSSDFTYASSFVIVVPNAFGKSILPHASAHWNAAVSSSLATQSSGTRPPSFAKVNGLNSRYAKW
jgi:hypothetical protein